jgi:PAS domain S-box-containing protein
MILNKRDSLIMFDILGLFCLTSLKATKGNISIRVLHVDDDYSFLEVSKDILMDMGSFVIDHASCVDKAFEKLAVGRYDVIVSDYEMPQKDGLQFLKELREQNNKIPFILFTGKGREEVAIKALNLGADAYHNKQGTPETVYGELSHNISLVVDRNKVKQALEESEKRYRILMEQASESIIVHDEKGIIIDANQRACKNLGYTKEELVGMTTDDIETEIPENQKNALFWLKIVAGEALTLESHQKRKDGSIFPVEVSLGPVIIDKKTLVIGLTRDITEHKKKEELLKDSIAKYREFAESLPELVFEIDGNGNLVFVNRATSKITGYSQDELANNFNIARLVVPDEQEKATMHIKRLMSGENVGPTEYTLIKKDGTVFPVAVWATPNIIQNKVAAIRGIAVDISERRKAEEDHKKNQLIMSAMNDKLHFVGALTRHDINNKLMSIRTSAYLLKKQIGDNPEYSKYLEIIESEVNSSDRIIEFSRLYEKIDLEQPTKMNVAQCFNQEALLLNLSAIKIVNKCQGLEVMADELIGQLFYNLVDNSLKHGGKVTQIRLHYTKEGDELKLFYEDNGVGVPKANKSKLFDSGFTTGKGSGLGLYLIKKMIDIYGWQIEEVGEVGKGAKFVITIPKLNPNGKENYQITK